MKNLQTEDYQRVRRPSNRRYPERKCQNCGKAFIPTDARSLYCCAQCGINYRNDQAKLLRQTRFQKESVLKAYDKALEKVYNWMKQEDIAKVSPEVLCSHGIKLEGLGVETMIRPNSSVIQWFYAYGVEAIGDRAAHFRIHKRTKEYYHVNKSNLQTTIVTRVFWEMSSAAIRFFRSGWESFSIIRSTF